MSTSILRDDSYEGTDSELIVPQTSVGLLHWLLYLLAIVSLSQIFETPGYHMQGKKG